MGRSFKPESRLAVRATKDVCKFNLIALIEAMCPEAFSELAA